MKERWRKIKGFPMYKISSQGRVKSYWQDHIKGKIHGRHIINSRHGRKYWGVILRVYSKPHNFRLHRLLAETFITNPNPEKYNMVGHKDWDGLNNSLENLYWTNQSEITKLDYKRGDRKRSRLNPNYYKQIWLKSEKNSSIVNQ